MGGTVILAIRKNGKTTTRRVPKYQGIFPMRGSFATGQYHKDPGFACDWKSVNNTTLAPEGYGLVVVDHDTQWVGSCSDYCGQHEGMFRNNREREIEDLITLFKQGRVNALAVGNSSGIGSDIALALPEDELTRDNLNEAIRSVGSDPEDVTLFAELLPPDGWDFDDYCPDESGDWVAMMEQMEKRGLIQPTEALMVAWDRYFVDKPFDQNPTAAWRARLQAQAIECATQAPAARVNNRRL